MPTRWTMAGAAESLDLSGVVSMLRRWQRVAWSTQDNPDAHRHMLASANRLSAGGDVGTESLPWRVVQVRTSQVVLAPDMTKRSVARQVQQPANALPHEDFSSAQQAWSWSMKTDLSSLNGM